MSSAYSVKIELASRYSLALLELSEERKATEEVKKDLQQIKAMIKESKDLDFMLTCPTISRNEKIKALTALSDKAKFCPTTRDFLAVVAANNRLFALAGMIDAYFELLDEKQGIITVKVISAAKLDEKQLAEISDILTPALGKKAVRLSVKQDKSLLGGMMVKIGSLLIDSSLKTKVQQLKTVMKGA